MSFPALISLLEDAAVARQPATFRVYLTLAKNQNIFFEPTPIKAWALAEQLGVHRETIQFAFKFLISNGYMVEVGREKGTNVRRVMLLREKAQACTSNPTPSAA